MTTDNGTTSSQARGGLFGGDNSTERAEGSLSRGGFFGDEVTGSQGPQGEQGPPGMDGTDGLPGTPGMDGAPGAPGADSTVPGPRGPAGDDGNDGMDGAPGMNGLPGTPGMDGAPGAPSTVPGPPGDDGTDGEDGTDGTDGAMGLQGLRGPQGPRGDAGNDGLPGNNGEDGDQGLQGFQGIGITDVSDVEGTNPGDDTVVTFTLTDPSDSSTTTEDITVRAGVAGVQGPRGLPGAASTVQGPPGTTGAQGIQGIGITDVSDSGPGDPGDSTTVTFTLTDPSDNSTSTEDITIPSGARGYTIDAAFIDPGVDVPGGTSFELDFQLNDPENTQITAANFIVPDGAQGPPGADSTVPGPRGEIATDYIESIVQGPTDTTFGTTLYTATFDNGNDVMWTTGGGGGGGTPVTPSEHFTFSLSSNSIVQDTTPNATVTVTATMGVVVPFTYQGFNSAQAIGPRGTTPGVPEEGTATTFTVAIPIDQVGTYSVSARILSNDSDGEAVALHTVTASFRVFAETALWYAGTRTVAEGAPTNITDLASQGAYSSGVTVELSGDPVGWIFLPVRTNGYVFRSGFLFLEIPNETTVSNPNFTLFEINNDDYDGSGTLVVEVTNG